MRRRQRGGYVAHRPDCQALQRVHATKLSNLGLTSCSHSGVRSQCVPGAVRTSPHRDLTAASAASEDRPAASEDTDRSDGGEAGRLNSVEVRPAVAASTESLVAPAPCTEEVGRSPADAWVSRLGMELMPDIATSRQNRGRQDRQNLHEAGCGWGPRPARSGRVRAVQLVEPAEAYRGAVELLDGSNELQGRLPADRETPLILLDVIFPSSSGPAGKERRGWRKGRSRCTQLLQDLRLPSRPRLNFEQPVT